MERTNLVTFKSEHKDRNKLDTPRVIRKVTFLEPQLRTHFQVYPVICTVINKCHPISTPSYFRRLIIWTLPGMTLPRLQMFGILTMPLSPNLAVWESVFLVWIVSFSLIVRQIVAASPWKAHGRTTGGLQNKHWDKYWVTGRSVFVPYLVRLKPP